MATTPLTIEATRNGTITRACARTLNRVICPCGELRTKTSSCAGRFSGSTLVADVVAALEGEGIAYRTVDAASLTGADKARHTREITRSRKAQTAREDRKAAGLLAILDAA